MKRPLIALSCYLLAIVYSAAPPIGERKIRIQESADAISLSMEGKTIWKLNHRASEGKPYFHPLATTGGNVLTELRPEDHPWHRAFWFSWKTINGVNYWEENRETGQSDGRTKLLDVTRSVSSEQVVTVKMELAYAPADGRDMLSEKRTLTLHPPDADGVYRLDWESVATALDSDVVLDRTPPPGQPGGKGWGGYAGYSIRLAKTVGGGSFLNSAGVAGARANRQRAHWMSYAAPDSSGGILVLDHPSNLGHPVRWYLIESMPFFSPAVIHDAAHTIKAGKCLRLRYRMIVYPSAQAPGSAAKEWAAWTR